MKFTLLPVLTLASVALAAPAANAGLDARTEKAAPCGSLSTGTLSCCDKKTTSNKLSPGFAGLLGALIAPVDVGVQCNPLKLADVLSGNGAQCQNSLVCCNTQGAPQTNTGGVINAFNGNQIPLCLSIPTQNE